MLLQESIGKERRPARGWLAIRAFIAPMLPSERERRKRGERIAVTNLRTPDEIYSACGREHWQPQINLQQRGKFSPAVTTDAFAMVEQYDRFNRA